MIIGGCEQYYKKILIMIVEGYKRISIVINEGYEGVYYKKSISRDNCGGMTNITKDINRIIEGYDIYH